MLLSFCFYKYIDSSHFFNNTAYSLKEKLGSFEKPAERFLKNHRVCCEMGLIKNLLNISKINKNADPTSTHADDHNLRNRNVTEHGFI